MKTKKLAYLFLFSFISLFVYAQPIDRINIACVGDGITYGKGIVNRESNSFPAQLERTLGKAYRVANFGKSDCTLMSAGDYPYISTDVYRQSLNYKPDIVLIMLGTDDAKTINRHLLAKHYKNDYAKLINSYRGLPSKPRVILITPILSYLEGNVSDSINKVFQSRIIPDIEALAYENNLEIIDMYHLFDTVRKAYLFPDKLYPSSLGASEIALHIANYLERPISDFKINSSAISKSVELFNFHGYQAYKFGENFLVEPKHAVKGNPWLIRARFWDHEPQTDIALLEQGFHIAYCDVADLYGSPVAVGRYNKFYAQMTSLGLSVKVVLEGMSRGGLIAFNWAAQNPDKVAAIYADAPVLDFKSWPLGLAKSEGSSIDTKYLFNAYSFAGINDAKQWKGNPIDQLDFLDKIPILLVVGDVDEIVPFAENGAIFERTLNNVTVIHKAKTGHHPHSLFSPRPIVRFILSNTGHYANPCIKPVTGAEYRKGAGWNKDADWITVAQEISDVLQSHKVDVLFLGNSITQALGSNNRKLINTHIGKAGMNAACRSWEQAGISGDKTQHLLWRLQNGSYEKSKPQKVFITIGVNNLGAGDNAQDTEEGIMAVINEAAQKFPQATVYTFGLLPAKHDKTDPLRQAHDKIHSLLAVRKLPKNVRYINLESHFVNADGSLKKNLYSADKLHLSKDGYKVWVDIIDKLIKQ